jgi:predicted acyltransferase
VTTTAATRPPSVGQDRLLSLDVFRGVTMFLLIGESTRIYELLVGPALQGTVLASIGTQFHHHAWNGLRVWDLVQPFFMFIVGVALPFSVAARDRRGDSRATIAGHAVQRALLLLLLGWALYCIRPGYITFRFQNVLAQLSVAYLIAFLMMRRPAWAQVAVSFALLAGTELLYRLFPVAGFDQPFVPDHNFGAWFDLRLSGELSAGHWVSFNAIPTAAHTMWGVLAGQCLMSGRRQNKKVWTLAALGLLGIAAGYALDPVTPIIKRISTTSFVILTGGWCLVALAFCYWLVDVRHVRRWATGFVIVGMNPLFIYLFTESYGTVWLASLVKPFTMATRGWIGQTSAEIVTALAAWALLCGMCYWLYRRKIIIRI